MTGRAGAAPRRTAAVGTGDPYADALVGGRGPLFLRGTDDGVLLPLDVERWCAPPGRADATVLRRCEGAVLDVGCGPGRMVAELAGRGHRALGVDTHPQAVRRTRAAGGRALCRNVYTPLPGEGGWHTALLLDGNIGIGGSPEALLARLAEVVVPDGRLLVEADGADVDDRMSVQFSDDLGICGPSFAWARVGLPALAAIAEKAAWSVAETWTSDGRTFTALRRDG